jgi:hypothetical protein
MTFLNFFLFWGTILACLDPDSPSGSETLGITLKVLSNDTERGV